MHKLKLTKPSKIDVALSTPIAAQWFLVYVQYSISFLCPTYRAHFYCFYSQTALTAKDAV